MSWVITLIFIFLIVVAMMTYISRNWWDGTGGPG
jgi:hypothetical protein